MPFCPTCGHPYILNTIFCEQCGAALYPLHQTEEFPSAGARAPTGPAPAVMLELLSGAHQFRLAADDLPAVIGRADADQTRRPKVDLAPYGGLERGVSRLHARLSWQAGRLMVEDLASTNGTWVNDVRLAPNAPHPLRDGDILRLGTLRLRVHMRTDRAVIHQLPESG
ncbi:MAG: FHA domain-containing protein [Anaerolineae bacterium]